MFYPREMPNGADPVKFEQAWVQSRIFMLDIIRMIHRLCGHHTKLRKTCLDVGPHLLGGTTLLKELHSENAFTRLKLDVSVIDLDDRFKAQCLQVDPDIDYLTGDVKELERNFDIVIASHVVEHVEDPDDFCKALQARARDFVIIACPWRELPPRTRGHVNAIEKHFTRRIGARDIEILTNYSWGLDREVCIFWLPGLAND